MTASYPVALLRDVQTASIARARLEGVDLALWRDDEDAVHVWEDRCPHRGVRLSAGRNLGHGLQGVYHGWTFGKDGSATNVPAEGNKAFPDIRVRTIASEVRDGFVWACLADSDAKPVGLEESAGSILLRPLHVTAPVDSVRAAMAGWRDLAAIVTPSASNTCVIYARTTPIAGQAAIETARLWNFRLCELRRSLERGA